MKRKARSDKGTGFTFPGTIQGFSPNRPIQKTTNFSFGVQRDIGLGTVVDVAYVGALGRHLIERENLNATPLGTNFRASSLDATNWMPYSFSLPCPKLCVSIRLVALL